MPSAEYDLWYLRAGIDQLEKYLLSKDIYRSIGIAPPIGEPPYPQLTLGNLLLARQRAQATARTKTQEFELDRLCKELEIIRSHWQTAWGKKASAELKARLLLWRDFLDDYRKDPAAQYDRYAYEAGRRATLTLLQTEAQGFPNAEQELLVGLDAALQALIIPGKFIWDEELASSFPRERFWFLYGNLPKY